MPTQVILDHVTWTPKQVTDGAEHGAVAQSPDVHEIQEQEFPVKATPPCRHAALGAISTLVLTATMLANMGSSVANIDQRPIIHLTVLNMQDPSAELAVPRVLPNVFTVFDFVILVILTHFHIAKVQKILHEKDSSRIFIGIAAMPQVILSPQ